MKISGIETFQLTSPLERPFGWSQNWNWPPEREPGQGQHRRGYRRMGRGRRGRDSRGYARPRVDRPGPDEPHRSVAAHVPRSIQREQRGRTRRVCHQRGRYGAVGHHRQGAGPAGLQPTWRQGARPRGGVCHRPLLHRGRVPDEAAERGRAGMSRQASWA